MNSEQFLVLNNESAPNPVAVIAITGQPILVVGEHAAVQQNPAIARNCKEGEAMEVTKCSKVNRNTSGTVRAEPSQSPALSGSSGIVSDTSKEMPVPYKDIELATTRKFHLKRIVEFTIEELGMNFNSPFPQTLLDCRIKESIKVRFPVSNSQVSVIARDSVNCQLANTCQWDEKIFEKYVSAFIDLLKPKKFKLVGLFGINCFAVHDVSEEENEDIVWLVGLDERVDFLRDNSQRPTGCLCIPSCGPPSKVKV
jgi:hypothetical protein